MPFKKTPDATVSSALIAFDGDGRGRTEDPDGINGRAVERLLQGAMSSPPVHVSFCGCTRT
jgi:hypothetical protein